MISQNQKSMTQREQQTFALLVPSCDKYSDIWPYFFKLLFKYWPEVSNYPIILLSNHKRYLDERVTTLTVGEERSWSDNVALALSQIENEYVMVMLEDFLLTERVDIDVLTQYFTFMQENSAGYLRLMANPPPNHLLRNSVDIGEIRKGAEYRTSLQLAFWKKDILQTILLPGESPWEFELKGSIRSQKLSEPFLSIQLSAKQPILYFPNSIVRGMWVIEAVQYLRSQGFHEILSRPIETRLAAIFRRNWLRSLISRTLVRPLKKLLSFMMPVCNL